MWSSWDLHSRTIYAPVEVRLNCRMEIGLPIRALGQPQK